MQKVFYILSIILIIISIAALIVFGLPLGIDFKGGSLMEIKFLPDQAEEVKVLGRAEVESVFKEFNIENVNIQKIGENALLLRFNEVDEQTHNSILNSLNNKSSFTVQEDRFDSVGPVIGKETMRKSIKAVIIIMIAIVLYVTWAFRKLSFPIKSWKYGIIALGTLFHDVVITAGVFSVYLYFKDADIGVPFIAAILTILGYSVNDTIVVFDRVRENLLKLGTRLSFNKTIVKSIKETLTRSINTSLTTLLVLLAIFFFGGTTIQDFVLVLIVGIFIGTYSSIAIAAPLLGTWVNWREKARR